MKKMILILLTFLLLVSAAAVSSQDEEQDTSMDKMYPVLKIKNPFPVNEQAHYYRFPSDMLFFEPMDLNYFPHETWDKEKWSLPGRWGSGKTYDQMIYLDNPVDKQQIHGTDVTKLGYLSDFYLYTDLFVLDNYPENTGSCYLYYSNSVITGLNDSQGVLIDPESGIYFVTNIYGGKRYKTYTPRQIKHTLSVVKELDPADYAFSPDELESSTFAASNFTREKIDEAFRSKLEFVESSFRMHSSPGIRVYRIEVVRLNGNSMIFINGKPAFSGRDNITNIKHEFEKPDKTVFSRVAWSVGPILNPEGLTVTCSVGNFYVFGTGKAEE